MKMKAVVVCPGRGTYNAPELGYLGRHFGDKALLARFDAMREDAGQDRLTALDGADQFSLSRHGRGDNASGLIFAASFGDFCAIDRDRIDVVAVTGNSMGWYTALACAGALSPEAGFTVANGMGTLMQEALIGGQLVYPWMDDDWIVQADRKRELLCLIDAIDAMPDAALYLSIDLGGMLVLAGNSVGLKAFEDRVEPVRPRYPMRLSNHAAFHTPLQEPVAARGRAQLPVDLFGVPHLPMIDGTGRIWWPGTCDREALRDYTLSHQVTRTYDFSRAIAVAAREFAPDLFIILGPGTTLGGAVAQSLILVQWRGMTSKARFQEEQANRPVLAAVGMAEQRSRVSKP